MAVLEAAGLQHPKTPYDTLSGSGRQRLSARAV